MFCPPVCFPMAACLWETAWVSLRWSAAPTQSCRFSVKEAWKEPCSSTQTLCISGSRTRTKGKCTCVSSLSMNIYILTISEVQRLTLLPGSFSLQVRHGCRSVYKVLRWLLCSYIYPWHRRQAQQQHYGERWWTGNSCVDVCKTFVRERCTSEKCVTFSVFNSVILYWSLVRVPTGKLARCS